MSSPARLQLVLCLLLLRSAGLLAKPAPAADLEKLAAAIGPAEARRALAGISARAEATGPRGAFVSQMISLADGTARFRLAKPDGSAEEATGLLVISDPPDSNGPSEPNERNEPNDTNDPSGRVYLRANDHTALGPADAAMSSFVRGHEVHRMLLDLERRFRADDRAAEPGCLALRGPDALAVTICRSAGSELPASIELELPAALGGGTTRIELGDWRSLHGVRLPFAADFLHAGERHTYRYSEVLPFRLAPGVVLPPGATAPDPLFARLGDLAELASAHERTLVAHRQSDVRILLDDAAERSIVSGRGTLRETGRGELAAQLGPYLDGIRFTRYEDVVAPVIAVSADGTLGWLACQIEAAGTSRLAKLAEAPPEPIAYGFTWVELYAGKDGRWQNIGNASSPRP